MKRGGIMTFEEIYKENYKVVYRYLVSLCKDNSLAEDILQQSFYKAFINLNKYDGQSKISTWLCTIARNELYNYYKKNKVTKYDLLDDIKDDEKGILERIIDKEKVNFILDIINDLEEIYQRIFILRHYYDLSYKGVAKLCNKSESFVRVVFYRTKLKVRERMKNYE